MTKNSGGSTQRVSQAGEETPEGALNELEDLSGELDTMLQLPSCASVAGHQAVPQQGAPGTSFRLPERLLPSEPLSDKELLACGAKSRETEETSRPSVRFPSPTGQHARSLVPAFSAARRQQKTPIQQSFPALGTVFKSTLSGLQPRPPPPPPLPIALHGSRHPAQQAGFVIPPPPPGPGPILGACSNIPPPPPGPAPVLSAWANLPHHYSSRQLIPVRTSLRRCDDQLVEDKVVYVPPFKARVYTTGYENTYADVERYLPLIKFADDDLWHPLPEAEAVAKLTEAEDRLLPVGTLPALLDARPAKLDVPRVHAAAALRTPFIMEGIRCEDAAHLEVGGLQMHDSDVESDDDSDDDDNCAISGRIPRAPFCRRCARVKRRALRDTTLTYYSVVHTKQEVGSFPASSGPGLAAAGPSPRLCGFAGQDIYRVVKTSSRDAAAAQAFYDAGANGWSTVFTCTVHESCDLSLIGEHGFTRVREAWHLAARSPGPVQIFF